MNSKALHLIPFFIMLILSSCGKECDCAVLFPDDDSLISIAVSEDPEINELIHEKFSKKWEQQALLITMEEMNGALVQFVVRTDSVSDPAMKMTTEMMAEELEHEYLLVRKQYEILKVEEERTDQKLRFKGFNKETDIKPYTGSCILETQDGSKDSLQAEFKDGVIQGGWKRAEP